MVDLRNYSHDFLIEFIDLYRNNTCLWKIKCKDYMNKNKKAAAYEELRAKLQEKDPNATKDSVVKKINSLRSCFRKELKKVKASEHSGTGEGDIYKPTLWYFDLLLFLLDQEIPRPSISNIEDNNSESYGIEERNEGSEDQVENDVNEEDESVIASNIHLPDTPTSSSLSTLPSRMSGIKRKQRTDKTAEVLDLVAAKLKAPEAEQFSSFGKHIAEELRSLPKNQALFCQKLINDAIFEAKLGNLDRGAKIITKYDDGHYQHLTPTSTVPSYNIQQQSQAAAVTHNFTDLGQYYSRFAESYDN